MRSTGQVLFASRIPSDLKEKLSHFCADHGVKMSFFVSQAIREKLEKIVEDESDAALLHARRKDADFVSHKDMETYFRKRFTKR